MIGELLLLRYIQAVKLMDNYTNNLVFHVLDASKVKFPNIIGKNSEEYKKNILRKYSDIKENYLLRKSQNNMFYET